MEKGRRTATILFVINATFGIPMACGFLLLFLAQTLGSESGDAGLEGIVVAVALILSAAIPVYSLFRPFSGGIALCVLAAGFSIVFNAFGLSALLLPSRPVGYHPFFSIVSALIAVLGILSVIRGRTQQKTALA